MKASKLLLVVGAALVCSTAGAQTANDRDVTQQQRIEQGLKSGELNTREAAKLERAEGHVDQMQANALKDGNVSSAEAERIKAAQNKTSAAIYRQKHDAQTGNPESLSSQRMQADVQRNINQEKRINAGVKSGELTAQETAHLERGQARADRREANAGQDGHVGAHEQANVQRTENHNSRKIRRQKHDAQETKKE